MPCATGLPSAAARMPRLKSGIWQTRCCGFAARLPQIFSQAQAPPVFSLGTVRKTGSSILPARVASSPRTRPWSFSKSTERKPSRLSKTTRLNPQGCSNGSGKSQNFPKDAAYVLRLFCCPAAGNGCDTLYLSGTKKGPCVRKSGDRDHTIFVDLVVDPPGVEPGTSRL